MQKRILVLLTLAAALFAASPVKAESFPIPSSTPLTATFGKLNFQINPRLFNSGIYGEADILFFGPFLVDQKQVEPKGFGESIIPAANLRIDVYVLNKNNTYTLLGNFTTLPNGQYNVSLPAGTYYLVPEDPFLEPISSGPIVVTKGQRTLFFLGMFPFD